MLNEIHVESLNEEGNAHFFTIFFINSMIFKELFLVSDLILDSFILLYVLLSTH